MGLTQRDVTSSMLISLSGNNQVAPNFWLNPANGVSYNVGVQTSQYRIDSLDELLRTPITAATSAVNTTTPGSLAGVVRGRERFGELLAERRVAGVRKSRGDLQRRRSCSRIWWTSQRSYGPVIINHYNVAPVFDVYANVDRRDLGSVGSEVEKIMQEEQAHLPRGTTFNLRGEYETMQTSFVRLGLGMVFAVVLVYLLMAVNFQSWLDPFIILTALPGRDRRNPVDAVCHRHHAERSVADGLHHVRRRRHGQQHSDGHVRERRARDAFRWLAMRCCRPATRVSVRC